MAIAIYHSEINRALRLYGLLRRKNLEVDLFRSLGKDYQQSNLQKKYDLIIISTALEPDSRESKLTFEDMQTTKRCETAWKLLEYLKRQPNPNLETPVAVIGAHVPSLRNEIKSEVKKLGAVFLDELESDSELVREINKLMNRLLGSP
jgi:hypothetical protein